VAQAGGETARVGGGTGGAAMDYRRRVSARTLAAAATRAEPGERDSPFPDGTGNTVLPRQCRRQSCRLRPHIPSQPFKYSAGCDQGIRAG
jgi:hypothetical protein